MWYLIPEIKSWPIRAQLFQINFFSRFYSGGFNPRGTDENHAASLKGQLASIHGSDQLGFWPGGEACNRISGIDPGTLPTDIHKERSSKHWLFNIVIPSSEFLRLFYAAKYSGFSANCFRPHKCCVADPDQTFYCDGDPDTLLFMPTMKCL
jgi:hypothetical protein